MTPSLPLPKNKFCIYHLCCPLTLKSHILMSVSWAEAIIFSFSLFHWTSEAPAVVDTCKYQHTCLPYSRKFLLVQTFVQMPPDPPEEFSCFSFLFSWGAPIVQTNTIPPKSNMYVRCVKRHSERIWLKLCGFIFIVAGQSVNLHPTKISHMYSCM